MLSEIHENSSFEHFLKWPINREEIVIQRLTHQLHEWYIEWEQWFRDYRNRMTIVFHNPLNHKFSNNELMILYEYEKELYPLLQWHNHIHYGVGVWETELELIRRELEHNDNVNIIAVDTNKTFLELFFHNLVYKIEEYKKPIFHTSIHTLFQTLSPKDIVFWNHNPTCHVCIWWTLGNFSDQHEMPHIFSKLSKPWDKVIVWYHLNTHFDEAFKKYSRNAYYHFFALDYLYKQNISPDLSKIHRKADKNIHQISMFYDSLEVFRTKKYALDEMTQLFCQYWFVHTLTKTDRYTNNAISIFEKK